MLDSASHAYRADMTVTYGSQSSIVCVCDLDLHLTSDLCCINSLIYTNSHDI